jgi:hypothetical protein
MAAASNEWVLAARTDTTDYYYVSEAVYLKYPDVVAIIKHLDRTNGVAMPIITTYRCDEWKVELVDFRPTIDNIYKPQFTQPLKLLLDVKKGTVAADMFNMFCSMLYKKDSK